MPKKRGDKPPANLVNIDAATIENMVSVFRVTRDAIYKWVQKGCPRKEDGTFSIYEVYNWLVTKDTKGGLVEQKLTAEIERIKAQTEKIGEKYMLRDDHDHIMNAWASSFKKFWAQAVKKNVIHFCGKDLDQLNILFEGFGRQIANVWADSWTEK